MTATSEQDPADGLFEAVQRGDFRAVSEMIGQASSAIVLSERETQLLFAYALRREDIVMIDTLAQRFDDPDTLGKALVYGAKHGCVQGMGRLLNAGARADYDDSAAFRHALANGHGDAARFLLSRGGHMNPTIFRATPNEDSATALLRAVHENDRATARALVAVGDKLDLSPREESLVYAQAVRNEDPQWLDLLLERFRDPATTGHALAYAARHGCTLSMQHLIDRGVDPNALNGRAMREARANGEVAALDVLVNAGAALVDKRDVSPDPVREVDATQQLFEAVRDGDLSRARGIIHSASDFVVTEHEIALLYGRSIERNDPAFINLLARRFPDSRSLEANAAYAAKLGQGEALVALLDNGVDPSARGGRALIHAVEQGHTQIAQLLLERGAAMPDESTRLVHALARHRDPELIKVFCDVGYGPAIQAEAQASPAHEADTYWLLTQALDRNAAAESLRHSATYDPDFGSHWTEEHEEDYGFDIGR